mmetsp:Transcript_9335/g.23181  ORF Transcript_9335/g.23181 Transcript_9335/m.23181 type:complete len:359 (+) Transcript_9335:622-1698(+)
MGRGERRGDGPLPDESPHLFCRQRRPPSDTGGILYTNNDRSIDSDVIFFGCNNNIHCLEQVHQARHKSRLVDPRYVQLFFVPTAHVPRLQWLIQRVLAAIFVLVNTMATVGAFDGLHVAPSVVHAVDVSVPHVAAAAVDLALAAEVPKDIHPHAPPPILFWPACLARGSAPLGHSLPSRQLVPNDLFLVSLRPFFLHTFLARPGFAGSVSVEAHAGGHLRRRFVPAPLLPFHGLFLDHPLDRPAQLLRLGKTASVLLVAGVQVDRLPVGLDTLVVLLEIKVGHGLPRMQLGPAWAEPNPVICVIHRLPEGLHHGVRRATVAEGLLVTGVRVHGPRVVVHGSLVSPDSVKFVSLLAQLF